MSDADRPHPQPMNRAARRQAARAEASPSPLCPAGRHAFRRYSATLGGAEVSVRIVCTGCRRSIEQVMEQQPEELAAYRAWLEAQPLVERGAGS